MLSLSRGHIFLNLCFYNMNHKEKIETIFSLLQDAQIVSYTGSKEKLILKILCPHLAQTIHPKFSYFSLELQNISLLNLSLWDEKTEKSILTDLADIFKYELDINAIVDNHEQDLVSIACYMDEKDFEGANLNINCQDIQLYDQENKPISLNDFAHLVKVYWQNL